jgi:hypothetical protein
VLALTLLCACVSLAADIDRGNDSSDNGVVQRCTSVDLSYPQFADVETVVEVHCETIDLVEVDLTRGRLARFASLLPRVGRMRWGVLGLRCSGRGASCAQS